MPIEAQIAYLNPEILGTKENPKTPVLGDKSSRHATTVKYTKTLFDGRAEQPSLDKNGVTMVLLKSAVKDYHDKDEVERVLYPETLEAVKRATNADYIHVGSHLVRSEDPKAEAKLSGMGFFNHAYARFAHVDTAAYSELMARKTLKRGLKLTIEECAPENMDVSMVNLWKPYDRPVFQNPLALLDGASMLKEDLRETLYNGDGGGGDAPGANISLCVDNPSHKWLYWPQQTVDEALIFKQMDTRTNVCQHSPHTSFDDPTVAKDVPGRRSIEVRLTLGYKKNKAKL